MNLKDFPESEESPFLAEVLEHIKEKPNRTKYISEGDLKMLDQESGSIEQAYKVQITNKHVDTQTFTKIYTDALATAINLKSTGQRVLLFFLEGMEKDSDLVEFNFTRCQEFCGFKSTQSVYAGLVELLEKRFIARTKLHYKYFINPTMFFNGNRLGIVKGLLANPKFKELPKSTDQF